jgi:hypothetical protein
VKLIPLTQGQFALVDDEDFERLSQFSWHAEWMKNSRSWRAVRNSSRDTSGRHRPILMHREVLNAKPGEFVDHRFHNTLDNRKSELRKCTKSQNAMNQRLLPRSTSGFKGVTWARNEQKWAARVKLHGKTQHQGYFLTALDAARAYDKAAIMLFGDFALTNKMLGLL